MRKCSFEIFSFGWLFSRVPITVGCVPSYSCDLFRENLLYGLSRRTSDAALLYPPVGLFPEDFSFFQTGALRWEADCVIRAKHTRDPCPSSTVGSAWTPYDA